MSPQDPRFARSRDQRSPHPAAALLLLLGAACHESSGSSSGGAPPGQTDFVAPLAAFQFPPDGCVTDGARVTLAIAASDASGVGLVRVAGIPAVRGPDSIWRVSVPLAPGFNLFHAETRDVPGNHEPFAALITVRRESALWIEPSALVMDPSTGDALVLDTLTPALFRVHVTGVRSLISGPGKGSGVLLEEPRELEFVAGHDAVLVTDGGLDALVFVDLASGRRRLLSGAGAGAGPALLEPGGIAVDLVRNRALVVDEGRDELVAVDLGTGQRSTFSSATLGSGPPLAGACRIALDPARGRALVTVPAARSILAVDLTTGDRSVLSGVGTGSGPDFVAPLDAVVELFGTRALVTDPGARAILVVDLETGERWILSSNSIGNGPDWLAPAGIAIRAGNIPVVIDSSRDALVELGFGDRRIVSGISLGLGPALARPAAVTSGPSFPASILVADQSELYLASTGDGTRDLLSGTDRGAGLPFRGLAAVCVSRNASTCITVLDRGLPGIVDVDVFGNRRTISAAGTGAGPSFSRPSSMILVPIGTNCPIGALVLDTPPAGPAALLRVDLPSGSRSILSDPTHGSGPDLVEPVALELDLHPLDAFALVLDAGLRAIFSVDLITGDRAITAVLPVLGTPTDMARDGTRMLVTVADPAALLVVEDGRTTVLSDATLGSGPVFARPVGVELLTSETVGSVPSATIAYVLDEARAALFAVDTRTGARVLRTK